MTLNLLFITVAILTQIVCDVSPFPINSMFTHPASSAPEVLSLGLSGNNDAPGIHNRDPVFSPLPNVPDGQQNNNAGITIPFPFRESWVMLYEKDIHVSCFPSNLGPVNVDHDLKINTSCTSPIQLHGNPSTCPVWDYLSLYNKLGNDGDFKQLTIIGTPSTPRTSRTRVSLPREQLSPTPSWLSTWTRAQQLWLERIQALHVRTLATLHLALGLDEESPLNLNATVQSDQSPQPYHVPPVNPSLPVQGPSPSDQLQSNTNGSSVNVPGCDHPNASEPISPARLQPVPRQGDMPPLLSVVDSATTVSSHVVADPVSNSDSTWTILKVSKGPLAPQQLYAFDDHIRSLPVMFKAHTVRRGYSALATALRASCGGRNLSRCNQGTKLAVQDSLAALSDLQISYNGDSAVDINHGELQRIIATVRASNSTRDEILQVYGIVNRDLLWLNALLQDPDWNQGISNREAHELVGFFVTLTALGRPVSRTQAYHLLTTTQMLDALAAGEDQDPIQMGLAGHKTARTYGCLFMNIAPWVRRPWQFYLSDVRPVLQKRMHFTTEDAAFPTTIDADVTRYLTSRGGKLTLAQLRSLVCRSLPIQLHVPSIALATRCRHLYTAMHC